MSRSAHQRQQQKLQMQQQQLLAQQMADNEAAAAAAEMFDLFCVATTMRQILGLHRQMCDIVGLRPAPLNEFYPKLKTKVRSWKAQALWKKFDARAAHRAYAKGTACTGARVLVIGAGPCGLRTAIEAQLLGAKVVVVEKRDRISRNNVLHLWPFVITDLRNLGAKKFYGKFCAGSIDHISIRQLQCILLKVALLLGVEIHEGVSFERTIEPSGDGCGWRASVTPFDHAVSHYEFDVLIGADGKRNTLEAFKRKEFRGKLAIAITANFINKKTEAEAKAEEISGVAFIFNQSFFKELYHTTGIDLENIVYYKDETHYFVMTAKKHSLIDKGVILQDFADPAELLAPVNVNTEKLLDYAREAAEFSTKYQMPNLEFAVNHYGKPDVAMFDFTSMFAAESSCRVIVRKGFRLLQCLVGDSLLEPFWPTGSGCARGFLSSMDAAYAIKLWSNSCNSTLGVVAQRESIYRLLGQTTPENLQRDIGGYTVDPATRYPNLNRTSVNVWQVKHLIDTDDDSVLEQTFMDTNALQATQVDTPMRRKRRNADTMPLSAVLLRWICAQLHAYEFISELKEVADVFTNGKVLCALINRYRPDLVDFNAIKDKSPIEQNDLAFKILDKDLHIPRIISGKDSMQIKNLETKIWLNYLEQICEVFRGEIPHVKHPKIDFSDLREKYKINYAHAQPDFSKLLQLSTKQKAKSPIQDLVDVPQVVQRRSVLDEEKLKRQRRIEQQQFVGNLTSAGNAAPTDTPRRAKKRRSADKAANIEERQKRLQEIEQNRQDRQSKRRQQRYQQTQNFYKSLHMLQANNFLREADENTPFEDYSIFLYRQQAPEFNDRVKDLERKLLYPDRDRSDIPSALPRSVDEQFSDRIKSMEQRISSRNAYGNDKKPKDLMRAIGKIDSNDWNVREIEKKIEQSKKTEVHGPKGREKVPKWSREQFQARQNKMAKPTRQDSAEEKFKEIDQTLKNLDKQLKEGNVLEVGKVASIAGQFVKRDDTSEEKNPPTIVPKSSTKVALAFKKQAASEKCHFCKQTVYLMEKLQTENLVMHRGCLKCHHCHTNLRLGAYAFDRDDPNGRFYCTQHFRLPAKAIRPVVRKPGQRKSSQQQQQQQQQNDTTAIAAVNAVAAQTPVAALINSESGDELKTPDKRGPVDNVAKLDLLERGQTPERIEFENTDAMSDGEPSEEHIIDEHEWSGRNFLPESNNDSESDLSSSDQSDSDSDSDMFEEANDSPLGAQTLQLASEWIGKQNYSDSDDSDDFYDSSEGMADDGKDDTEGEEFAKARELRREEVRLPPLPPNLPTDTETEVMSTTEVPSNNGEDNNKNQVNKENESEDVNKDKQLEVMPKERKDSALSNSTDLSYKSVDSLTNGNKTAAAIKKDIEKLDQNCDHKFSADIDAISEKLYRLNNVVKMNKDLETIAKENLIRSDILKKLSMKEKWLAENKIDSKSVFQEKVENFLKPIAKLKDEFFTKKKDEKNGEKTQLSHDSNSDPFTPISKFNDILTKSTNKTEQKTAQKAETLAAPKSKFKNEAEKNAAILDLIEDLKNKENHNKMKPESNIKMDSIQEIKAANQTVAKSNVSKSQTATSSPLVKTKSSTVAKNRNSENEMELEGILDVVKKIDLSKSEANAKATNKDMGHLLYKVEGKFSPKPNKKMMDKLKEIEAKSFSGTLDSIKSQIETPNISAQMAPSNVDLSKYFPNPKQEEKASNALNKNQKTLSEIDLTKYFPSSPVPQRKSNVVTVADKLKKSQTEKSLAVSGDRAATTVVSKSKRHAPLGSSNYSLKDNQLDGTVDIIKKKSTVKVVTTTAVANPGKKGNVKIVRKIVPKGTKSKKNLNVKKTAVMKNEDDRILDEILESGSEAQRSPSLEYQQLFQGEKSPSEDISDKIERILQETGIDFGVQKERNKLLNTTITTDDKELRRKNSGFCETGVEATKEISDNFSGVQNILKRFESLSSVSSSDHAFKLRRMESTTSNLNKSRESLTSRESDNYSDLEKTMEYLKTEWRSEATNFLQNKRNDFQNKKQTKENCDEAKEKRLFNELPVQYKESKIAKFFGLKKQATPEKRKSPIKKKKSPEKKLQNSTAIKKPALYTSLEELALISVSKQTSPTTTPKLTHSNMEITCKKNNLVEKAKPKEKFIEKQTGETEILKEEKPAKIRPLIEDIKNLPKTGCDKSLSSSRRGSQTSLQSRRCSNASVTEKLENAAVDLEKLVAVNDLNTANTILNKSASKSDNYETDSLCTSISKSPSVAPITVQMRGSSEDESIEKLFSKFSDEMLVNVEFDSNDELIAITPRSPFKKEDNSDEDILERVPSLERDSDKLTSLENFSVSISNKMPIKTSSINDFNFPNGPQQRQKSLSSSSESTAPLAPQRLKKKLARLSPSNIAPSVQDLMLAAAKNDLSESAEKAENNAAPLKFPRIIDEDDILLDETQTPYKYFTEPVSSASKSKEDHLKNFVEQPIVITTKSLNDGFQSIKKLPENVTEFTKVLRPISHTKESLVEKGIKKPENNITDNKSLIGSSTGESLQSVEEILQPKLSRREPSLEWNMEMMPHSPMPPKRKVSKDTKMALPHATSKESLNKFNKPEINLIQENKTLTDKIHSNTLKENSTEISMDGGICKQNDINTKEIFLTTKPETVVSTSINDSGNLHNLREKSPTISIKQLNNIDANTEALQKRLIEEFELERRHALVERDKQYQVMDKPDLKPSSSKENSKSSSIKSTPLVTPSKQSPRDSRRSSIQSTATNRGGTPPMMKPLEIPSSPLSSQTSRRSSFAFIELLDCKPVIAPMPKKLDLPKIEDSPEIPDNLNQSPAAEDAKKRPWPKLQQEEDDDVSSKDEHENSKKYAGETVEYANIPAYNGPKRDWPDGKTMFNKKDKVQYYKPRSETPETNYSSYDPVSLEKARLCSKSITDLRKLQSPYNSNYSLATNGQTALTCSSNDSIEVIGHNIKNDFLNATPQRPVRKSRNTSAATTKGGEDLSTEMLLERSKRLHNRKRDFVNERVVERNPYMKDVLNEERRNSGLVKDNKEDSDITTTYRSKHYTPSCVQSESETTSPDEIELNSATEISTDSEFDQDEMIREAPKIFIDDTHLRKPTKVQIKSTVIPPSMNQKYNNTSSNQQQGKDSGTYLTKYQTHTQQPIMPQFKPLVQVDPSLLNTNRTPLQNPRPGDYLLNKTASTEGIASKKSLELKKRYLLGEQANGNKIQKSGSTSVLDSRIRTFQSNISECQKLLNPSSDISPSMKTFLDRTKLGEKAANELMKSATNNIINDLKVEITIQKASSTASTDNEKENVFVNSKNELNKCLEYSDSRKSNSSTPTNNKNIIETIDLVTPEKEGTLDTSDSNKVIDLTEDSPIRSNKTIIEAAVVKADLPLDFNSCVPDILGHIEKKDGGIKSTKQGTPEMEKKLADDEVNLIDNNMEKVDVPEKLEAIYDNEMEDVQIEVPNIAWNSKSDNISLSSNCSCSSHSSSLEDIEHYILESTTSPETHNSGVGNMTSSAGANHQVPRLEIHDTTGTLMQIDSLMIIDGKYVGDPEDLKFIEVPEGIIVPEVPAIKTSEIEDEHEVDIEPVTATPEPAETTIIEAENIDLGSKRRVVMAGAEEEPPPLPEVGPPLPEKGPPKTKPFNFKFDTKNENKIESLKNLPLIVDATSKDYKKAVKPITLNLSTLQKTPDTPTNPKSNFLPTPTSPLVDMDKTPTGEVRSRASDSETEPTGTAHILTETELSDWTADDCISENFVDMDFVHNSNKTSIKGGKRQKKRNNGSAKGLPTSNEVLQEVAKAAPVAEIECILKYIDIDDIEFMDTGSDGSGTEPLSATNTALLRNRGYMEFVDNSAKPNKTLAQSAIGDTTSSKDSCYKPSQTKRNEKLGIDYIEQGAYIMHDDINKTPVNEAAKSVSVTQMTQSLTDSSIINDAEDESTCVLSSQILQTSVDTNTPPSKTTVQTATTEESEALTVVTSPFDSSTPHTQNSNNLKKATNIETVLDAEKDDSSTPSSSDRAPKTSQSTSCTNSAPTSSKNTPPCQTAKNQLLAPTSDNSLLRKSNDELSYEEYVRVLQQKIVQISTTALGDSMEARKQRRKSSKGEAPIALTNPNQTVIETTPTTTTTPLASTNLRLFKDDKEVNATPVAHTAETKNINTNVATVLNTQQLNKVPETPTLTSKLEEITKERTKQKDLIHDLVMDKLQSKKQLNAEKRLHRSRQRTLMTSGAGGCGLGGGGGYSSGSSLSPTPKLAAAISTTDTNCTNQAHYHVSTAATETLSSSFNRAPVPLLMNKNSGLKQDNKSSDSYVAAYGLEALSSPTRARAYKERPFSEHLEGDSQNFKINNTPSFSSITTKQQHHQMTQPKTSHSELATPILTPAMRQKQNADSVATTTTPTETNNDSNFLVSTENLRSEARARARLKSNSELGLSPEEKMQILRKRLQNEYSSSNVNTNAEPFKSKQSSYERPLNHKRRENKMNTSKSVNDLAFLSQLQNQNTNTVNILDNRDNRKISDFTSDPNLLLSSTQTTVATMNCGKQLKTKSGRRAVKDPERRKSLIQSLSSFFYKGQQNKEYKHQKDSTASTSTGDGNSAQPERPGTNSGCGGSSSTSTSQTISSGIDGVLSRFRISPKSKEKSRDKEDDLYNMANYTGSSPTRRLRTSSASSAITHERQNNSDFSNRTQLLRTPYSHSQINNLNSNNNNNNSNNKTNCRHRHYEQYKQQQQSSTSAYRNSQHLSHTPNKKSSSSSALAFSSSSPQLCVNKSQSMTNTNVATAAAYDDQTPPPIPPLPLNYQRSDDESYPTETRDQKKQRAISKAVRQAELKRLRIAQEIQREQEEIEVQLKELETRGVLIEKALRGEEQNFETTDSTNNVGSSDEKLLKELLEIWRYITQLKKRDDELGIRQQELQLEHRHAQLKEELNLRLSCNKLDKNSADVAAEGAILNEMLEIVAKRAALRPSASNHDLAGTSDLLSTGDKTAVSSSKLQLSSNRGQSNDNDESNI